MTLQFRCDKKIARLHDPRRNFELVEIESEVRYDPLTGASGRICHFSLTRLAPPDLSAIIAESRAACPFCPDKVNSITPRFPDELAAGGRLRNGQATLFPNLFPYDDVSAVAALCPDHFHPMDAMPEQPIRDGIGLAREFFALAGARVEDGRAFGLVTWNYMPPSGASQVHPHLQVVLTANPGNALARELAAESEFFRRHGRCYAEALLAAETAAKERFLGASGAVAWLAPFVPCGLLGDCVAVFPGRSTIADLSDADIADFARGFCAVLRAFSERGLWSFNLSFFPARFGPGDGSHWLLARVLPRFYLNAKLHVSDASYLQLLLEERFAMIRPEE
ncbi:MAG: hypothetical protein HYU75_09565, partial [Betaproteobacteria bacterium]|nr:hypothetical protein [Betaproteobacteria bacterium]